MRFCHSFRSGIPLFRAGHLRVTHPFATNVLLHPSDLHVLGTPPAFILSQDQTLRYVFFIPSFKDMLSFFALRNQSGLFLHFCCFSIVKVLRALVSQAQRLIICVSLISSRFFFEKSLRSFFPFFPRPPQPFF